MRCNFQPRLTSSVCRKTRVVHPCQKESNKVGLLRHTAIQHRSFHVAPLFLHGRNPTYRRQTSIIFCTVVSFFLKLFVEGKAGVAHVGSSIKGFYEAKKEFLFFFCFVVCPAPVATTNTQQKMKMKIKRIIAKHLMNYRHHLYCLFFFFFFWVWEGGKRDLMSCVGFCVSCAHTQTHRQWR